MADFNEEQIKQIRAMEAKLAKESDKMYEEKRPSKDQLAEMQKKREVLDNLKKALN